MYVQAVGYIKLITVHTHLYTFDSMNEVFSIVLCNLFNYARPTWALQDTTNECKPDPDGCIYILLHNYGKPTRTVLKCSGWTEIV